MRASLLLAAVCLGWGTIPLVAAETDLPAIAIVFSRVVVATIALGALVAVQAQRQRQRQHQRQPAPALFRHRPLACLAVGTVLAAHWTTLFAAYQRAPADTVIFIVFLAPVGIALIERPGPALVGALTIAVAGMALVAGPSVDARDARAAGLAFAAASAVLFVVLVLMSKPLAAVYGGLRLTLIETAVATIALVPFAATADWSRAHPATWAWLALLGLVHTAFGTAVYLWALARLPATEVGILGYLEPVGVVLWAWALASDTPTITTLAGGALVVAGGMLATTANTNERPAHAPAG